MNAAESKHWPVFWIGAVGALLMALFGMFGPHDGAMWRVPGVLQNRVEAALRLAGAPSVEVEMHGQEAHLHGILSDTHAIERAMRAAQTAAGPGGLWAGGVTGVNVSGLVPGPTASPFSWRVKRDGVQVRLTGSVPSERARAQILQAVARAFPNAEAVDEMQLAGGAPAPNWTEMAKDAIARLGALGGGEVRMVDEQIVVLGDGTTEQVQALQSHYAELAAPFRARVDVTVNGEASLPSLDGLDLSGGDAATCQQGFQRVMRSNTINFTPGSAEIDASSAALLDALASVALRCDRFTIQAVGHTDNDGARDLNMELSRRRAETVVDYLARQGVAPDRLRALGYGPDRPLQSNATPAGQAANRRIEFNVSG